VYVGLVQFLKSLKENKKFTFDVKLNELIFEFNGRVRRVVIAKTGRNNEYAYDGVLSALSNDDDHVVSSYYSSKGAAYIDANGRSYDSVSLRTDEEKKQRLIEKVEVYLKAVNVYAELTSKEINATHSMDTQQLENEIDRLVSEVNLYTGYVEKHKQLFQDVLNKIEQLDQLYIAA
jgi:hypothetical protein